ncbi:MAG: hypothetical protein IPN61_18165 [Bacteroidetes bacterium]|nr:hypothetical protein [Bacteroidota bacterium]
MKKDYNKLDSIKQALIDEYLKNLSEKQLKNRKLKSEIPPDDKSEEFYSLIGIWVVFGIGSLLVGAILFYGFGIKIK